MDSNLVVVQNRKAAALTGPVAASGTDATTRFLNFLATRMENDNTRAAYLRAAREFSRGATVRSWGDWRTFSRSTSPHGSSNRSSPLNPDRETSPRCDPPPV